MGEIKNHARAVQVIDFSGLRYGKNLRPTDIDGLLEYRNKAFVFFEMKYGDAPLPEGQRIALEHLVESFGQAGKSACAFVCRHDVTDPYEDIIAEETIVSNCLCNNGWKVNGKTLGECLKNWLKFTCPKALEE